MGSEFKDFYKVIGLEQSATQDEIKKKFRKLAQQHHPDVNKSLGSESRFKEISEAYDVLGDTKKRAEYDQLYHYWKQGGSFSGQPGGRGRTGFNANTSEMPFDVNEMFNNLFGQETRGKPGGAWFNHFSRSGGPGSAGFSHAFNQAPKPAPTSHTVEISLEEAFHGCKRNFNLHGPTGNRSIKVSIPAGVKEGQKIRLGAKDGHNNGGIGELFLEVKIKPHRHFRLEGRDLYLDLPLAPWEAALGATVTVPTLGGQVKLTIPEGSQSGKQLVLKGRGLPGKPPGNYTVVLNVVLPQAKSESNRAYYRQMQKEMPFDPRSGLHY
ncbi:MAG: DnaJ domain-containing protein [Magnetococcales bacterium]|nr:DnaJ domain-containing protein [Magnetococcales bacterium]